MRRVLAPLFLLLALLFIDSACFAGDSIRLLVPEQGINGMRYALIKAARVNGRLPSVPWGDRRYNETSERLELVFLVGSDGPPPATVNLGMVKVPLDSEADLASCESFFYDHKGDAGYKWRFVVHMPRLPGGIKVIDVVVTVGNTTAGFTGVPVASELEASGPNAPVYPKAETGSEAIESILAVLRGKDPNAIRELMTESGFDLGYDILCSPDHYPIVTFGPVGNDSHMSIVLCMFDTRGSASRNYALLLRKDIKWRIMGLFPERPIEQQVRKVD